MRRVPGVTDIKNEIAVRGVDYDHSIGKPTTPDEVDDLLRASFTPRWLVYASIWWLMFVLGEIGQTIGFGYSTQEAVAGIISESIYFPVAAFVTSRLVGTSYADRSPKDLVKGSVQSC